MPNDFDLTDREILEKMRNHVNSAQGGGANVSVPLVRSSRQFAFIADKGVPGYHLGRLRQDVEVVYQLQSTVGTINPRPGGLANQAIQYSKKLLARVLSWYTRPLHQFQAAVARAFEEQLHALESLQNQVTNVSTMAEQRAESIEEDVRRLSKQQKRFASLADQQQTLEKAGEERTAFQFVNEHLGERSRDFSSYLSIFENNGPVWDLAAGKGEFMEFLRTSHVQSLGVESNPEACSICRDKGLQVTCGDLFDFLQNAKDASAGGIFASRVIERVSPELQLCLIDLCRQKLRRDAPLLIEGFNPECLMGVAANFHVDPTNLRPVHHEYLSFVMRNKGFRDVRVILMNPVESSFLEQPSWSSNAVPESVTKAVMQLNRAVFGPQFYAVVGWRS